MTKPLKEEEVLILQMNLLIKINELRNLASPYGETFLAWEQYECDQLTKAVCKKITSESHECKQKESHD